MSQNPSLRLESKTIPATVAGTSSLDYNVTLSDLVTSVVAVVEFGATVTVDAANLPYIQVFQASISDYSDAVEVAALKTPIVAGMASLQQLVELVRPTKKYVRIRINRGGGSNSIQVAGGEVLVFNSRVYPEPLPATQYSKPVLAIGL